MRRAGFGLIRGIGTRTLPVSRDVTGSLRLFPITNITTFTARWCAVVDRSFSSAGITRFFAVVLNFSGCGWTRRWQRDVRLLVGLVSVRIRWFHHLHIYLGSVGSFTADALRATTGCAYRACADGFWLVRYAVLPPALCRSPAPLVWFGSFRRTALPLPVHTPALRLRVWRVALTGVLRAARAPPHCALLGHGLVLRYSFYIPFRARRTATARYVGSFRLHAVVLYPSPSARYAVHCPALTPASQTCLSIRLRHTATAGLSAPLLPVCGCGSCGLSGSYRLFWFQTGWLPSSCVACMRVRFRTSGSSVLRSVRFCKRACNSTPPHTA